jgi:hypothetical protein
VVRSADGRGWRTSFLLFVWSLCVIHSFFLGHPDRRLPLKYTYTVVGGFRVMFNSEQCRKNSNNCIDIANNLFEPHMRAKLLAIATAWLELAGELEREATEHEELLQALRRHFQSVHVFPTKH